MVDDRYRNYEFPSAPYDRDRQDYGRDYGSGRDYAYSSAREYLAAGQLGGRNDRYSPEYRDDRNFRAGGTGYRGSQPYSGPSQNYSDGQYRGAYTHDGHRFTEAGNRDWDRNSAPQGYDHQQRGMFSRAGDEVRSWFGDEQAERRREADQRYDERMGEYGAGAYGRDHDYDRWRRGQIDALDRDYHEYRQENAKKFENDFGTWRTRRQTQRSSLGSITEHMDVVGSDGEHVGTVDNVRGERVILTRSDADAGGHHHSFPSSWIETVDTRVTLAKTAQQAKDHWRDEERAGAMFGSDASATATTRDAEGRVNLNRSFSGTY